LSVKYVEPDDPVRTSIVLVPVNVSVFPELNVRPLAPTDGATTPSTQTFIHALVPLIEMTSVTPLYATVTVLVTDADLPSVEVAVIVIDQRPWVSSRGVAKVPSSLTGTDVPGGGLAAGDAPGAGVVTGVGAGGGTGPVDPGGPR